MPEGRQANVITHELQSCIDASREVRNPTALRSLLAQICDVLGFDDYAIMQHVSLVGCDRSLGHIRRGEKIAAASYHEAWKEKYVENNIVSVDPVVLASQRTVTAFRWNDLPRLIRLTSDHRNVIEFMRRGNVEDGFAIPVNAAGEPHGSCHFSVRRGHDLPVHNLPLAPWLACVGFEAARLLLESRRALGHETPSDKLTDRQLECVVLMARGFREADVAKRLGIATHTVKRHLQEARGTLRVRKTIQLVIRALQTGQITIADVASEEAPSR